MALVLVPLAPAGASEPDSLAIPAPRDGDRAEVTYAIPGHAFARSFVWSGPVAPWVDTYGVERQAFRLDVETASCYCEGDGATVVEAGSLLRIASDLRWVSGPGRYHPTPIHTREVVERGEAIDHRGRIEPFWALQGRTLVEGDQFRLVAPPSPWWIGTYYWIDMTVAGWTEHEGSMLFLVQGVDRWGGPFELWFDGVAPVPVHATARMGLQNYGSEHRLVSFTQGDGPALVAPGYAPPPFTEGAADVPRAPVGADGPDEPMLVTFPLARAALVARADPRVAHWLDTHPGAYVVGGEGREDLERHEATWTLVFGAPPDLDARNRRLVVELEAPALVGPPLVTDVVETFSWERAAPLDSLAGRSQACTEAAEARAASRASGFLLARDVAFESYDGEYVCTTELTFAREGHGGALERTVSARARLQGTAGWIGEELLREIDAEHSCTGELALVLPWHACAI